MRRNKQSLIAVLEAFVHDPLLSWKVLQAGQGPSTAAGDTVSTRLDSVLEHVGSVPSLTAGRHLETPKKLVNVNEKAYAVIHRVQVKLCGRDFSSVGGGWK